MSHPIIQRELLGALRRRRTTALLVAAAVVFSLLVISRWPADATVELSGAQAQEVFQVFSYGLLAVLVLLVPAIPATSIVRERQRGTLALLLNSPLSTGSIYFGKLAGMFIFISLLLAMSIPAAAAAFAMGGISLVEQILPLYGVLLLVLLEYTTLALMVSSYATSLDAALRITYALVLVLAVGVLGPHYVLREGGGMATLLAEQLRNVSPIPALMGLAGHGDVGVFTFQSASGTTLRFVVAALGISMIFAVLTLSRLHAFLLERPRPQGIVTDERSTTQRVLRRFVFLVDPQRRKKGIHRFMNPVMVKEFRTRRFGRSHWLIRLVAASAVFSLYLAYAAIVGTIDWGVGVIGGIMVVLQVTLVLVITPSLAATLISAERESRGWELLIMTPLSPWSIIRGKLASVLVTLALVLLATLPGYLVMIWIHPPIRWQVWQVLICLGWMTLLAVLLSAAVSSLCQRAALATTISYALLGTICVGTMVVWLGRGTTFGHDTIQAVLRINPMAAALNIIETPGFENYELVPANWWLMGLACALCFAVLAVQTWRLTRPQ